MDAGKSSSPFSMDGKKFTPKPFTSCYNQCSTSVTGKLNPMDSSHFSYSGLHSGVQKPLENSRHFILAQGTSPSSAVTNSFSPLFHTDETVEGQAHGRPVLHKPQQKNPKGVSVSHKHRPEGSFVFPLPWHATKDQSESVAQAALGYRSITTGTEVCTINQNPADFSTPGPENVYMIDVEDLKFRGERCYKSKFALENADGPNRQKKIMKSACSSMHPEAL